MKDAKKAAGMSKYFIRLVSPLARRILVRKSPYLNRTTEYDNGTAWEYIVKIFGLDEEAV